MYHPVIHVSPTNKHPEIVLIQSLFRHKCVFKTQMDKIIRPVSQTHEGQVTRLFWNKDCNDILPTLVIGKIIKVVNDKVTIKYEKGQIGLASLEALDLQQRTVIHCFITEPMPNYFTIEKKRKRICFTPSNGGEFAWYVPSVIVKGIHTSSKW